MTIKNIIEIAAEHFREHHSDALSNGIIYERFANEQLNKENEELCDFIDMTQFDNQTAEEKEVDLFYTWYYINYVHPHGLEEGYSINLRSDSIPSFTDVIKLPVRLQLQGNFMVATPCPPEEASFWCVYLLSPHAGRTCIADCLNEQAADKLLALVRQASARRAA